MPLKKAPMRNDRASENMQPMDEIRSVMNSNDGFAFIKYDIDASIYMRAEFRCERAPLSFVV